MDERIGYINKLLNTIDYYGFKFARVKNREYILLSSLEKECINYGSSIDEFFHSMENEDFHISPEYALESLPISLIMKAVDSIRREKKISKHLISRSIEMDRANYQKLYRAKGSINFVSFTRLLEALDVDLLTFLSRCRAINNGGYQ